VEDDAKDDHRPWPKPSSNWVMRQKWHDLLFMHWPVPASALRALIPRALEPDSFDGQCWVGVVPFRMTGVRFRGVPPIPGTSSFCELNVRTYVTAGGKPGVWFFSLDAANAAAVAAARRWFHLPYFRAQTSIKSSGEKFRYDSNRKHSGAPPANFRGEYAPSSAAFAAKRGTIEHFLTERYCLYAAAGDKIFRGEIHHPPWPLQAAKAEIEINTMAAASGIQLPSVEPLLHFSKLQIVEVWSLKRA
jgi:uncharacterized protein